MTTDAVLVVPHTAEVLDLTAETPERLAEIVDELRVLEEQSKSTRYAIGDELIARMDRRRKWTIHAGPFTVSAPSDALVSAWDTEALLEALDELVADGTIDTDAMSAAITPKPIEYAVHASGVNALLRSPVYGDRIAACRTLVEPAGRRAKVSRA